MQTSSPRIAVVGGGIIGLGSSWELARRGFAVTVFERRRTGRAASWAAGGMLAPVSEAEVEGAGVARWQLDSLRLWPEFAARLEGESGEPLGFEQEGILSVALTPYDEALLERRVRRQEAFGLSVQRLTGEEARRREPLLSPHVRAAALAPGEGTVDPRRVVTALERVVRQGGVQVREGDEVRRIECGDDGVRAVHSAGGRTPFDAVVLAAGAWSGEIEGIPETVRPPVRPVLGQMVCLAAAERPVCTAVRGPRAYLIPRADGQLLVGATAEERGFDERVTAEGVRLLLEGAFELLPGSAEMQWVGAWSGLRPATPNHEPLVGASAVPGLFLATGHYRNGVLGLPRTARDVADAVASTTGDRVTA